MEEKTQDAPCYCEGKGVLRIVRPLSNPPEFVHCFCSCEAGNKLKTFIEQKTEKSTQTILAGIFDKGIMPETDWKFRHDELATAVRELLQEHAPKAERPSDEHLCMWLESALIAKNPEPPPQTHARK